MHDLLQAFGIDWKLIAVQTVNFLVVLIILTYFLYRPVLRVIQERKNKIAAGMLDAERAQRLRADVESEKGDILSEAHHEGEKIIARAEEEGKHERSQIVKAAQAQADQVLKDAQVSADEIARKAVHESEKEVARHAILAAEKILRTHQ